MGFYIGLDLGGTNLKYAVGDEAGNIKIKKIKPSLAQKSAEAIFNNIFEAVEEIKREAGVEIKAIGLGTPGSVDFKKGKLLGGTPNIPAWTDAPIKEKMEHELNIPVWVDNDANLMTLAEARVGAAKGYSHVLCVTIGTGIGGGIIINNELYRGVSYAAAEIGHITVEMNGKQCNCGNWGCLEVYAAAPAMIDRYRRKLRRSGLFYHEEELSTELIFQKAAVDEDLAIETISETCYYLGAGIASMVNIINPQIVVIGGGVAEAGADFIQQIETNVHKRAMKASTQNLKIVKAQLGNDAGMVGAILLAAEN